MILIYSIQMSPRLKYTADVIFKRVLKLKIPVMFTQEMEEFLQFDGKKINYSLYPVKDSIHIPCSGFLFQTGVKPVFPGICHGAFGKALFPVDGSNDFTYDLFAAVFYMVSRYEEYLPFERDKHGRFQPEHSLAFKNNFLDKPVVHYWVEELKDRLMLRYPSFSFPKKKFRFISTIDVDNGYAFKGKNVLKMMGAAIRDIIKGDIGLATQRIQVVLGLQKDPYDQYTLHKKIKTKYKIPLRYFILSGQPSSYDHNLPPYNNAFKDLVKRIRKFSKIGIHPSYFSNQSISIIESEIKTLEKIYGKKITESRQHFIRLDFPQTYRQLIKSGIRCDYSMGFPTMPGFRAGIAEPYLFYDLTDEKIKRLFIRPFQIIDTSYIDYLKLNPQDALKHMKRIADEVKMVNGMLITIFHDRTFSQTPKPNRWRSVYQKFIKSILG